MKKYLIYLIFLSFGFSLDVYSGGKLSSNQAAMDVTHYTIKLKVDPYKQTISGIVNISFILIGKPDKIEIDLLDDFHVSGTAIDGMNLSFTHKNHKILNFEMETSALYGLSALLGHKSCTVCAVIGNRFSNMFSENYKKTVNDLVKTVLKRL